MYHQAAVVIAPTSKASSSIVPTRHGWVPEAEEAQRGLG